MTQSCSKKPDEVSQGLDSDPDILRSLQYGAVMVRRYRSLLSNATNPVYRTSRSQLVDAKRFGTFSRSMMDITLHHVTQKSEIERLVEINHDAMLDDPVFHWMELYTDEDEDTGTRAALSDAIDDSCYEIVKAVTNDPTAPEKKMVVGFVHYFRGFIQLPQDGSSKGDFQKKPGSDAPQPSYDEARLARLAIGNGMYTHSRNFYISTIRGQKHQCACCCVLCLGELIEANVRQSSAD